MMVMPANNMSGVVHYIAGVKPDRIGILNTPFSYKTPPFYMPYALDNGCFTRWDEKEFFLMLRKASLLKRKPLWVCVPDVVADAEETNKRWHKYHNLIEFKKAFVAQDGHEPQDVPKEAYAVFIGGTTKWKIDNAHKFKGITQWLHVGRVNTWNRLKWAELIGADSVDGTGFFRGNRKQFQAMLDFCLGQRQGEMF